jgi:hypothetical protein
MHGTNATRNPKSAAFGARACSFCVRDRHHVSCLKLMAPALRVCHPNAIRAEEVSARLSGYLALVATAVSHQADEASECCGLAPFAGLYRSRCWLVRHKRSRLPCKRSSLPFKICFVELMRCNIVSTNLRVASGEPNPLSAHRRRKWHLAQRRTQRQRLQLRNQVRRRRPPRPGHL